MQLKVPHIILPLPSFGEVMDVCEGARGERREEGGREGRKKGEWVVGGGERERERERERSENSQSTTTLSITEGHLKAKQTTCVVEFTHYLRSPLKMASPKWLIWIQIAENCMVA